MCIVVKALLSLKAGLRPGQSDSKPLLQSAPVGTRDTGQFGVTLRGTVVVTIIPQMNAVVVQVVHPQEPREGNRLMYSLEPSPKKTRVRYITSLDLNGTNAD